MTTDDKISSRFIALNFHVLKFLKYKTEFKNILPILCGFFCLCISQQANMELFSVVSRIAKFLQTPPCDGNHQAKICGDIINSH